MTDDQNTERGDDSKTPATREYLDLKLAGFRSEMRLLFVVAIAGNTLLSHLTLSPTVGALGSGAAVVGAVLLKLLVLR